MSKLHSGNVPLIAAIFCVTAIGLHAQTLTTLHNFDGTDGQTPLALVQGNNGILYGTTEFGGIGCPGVYLKGCGTVYGITANGQFSTIYKSARRGIALTDRIRMNWSSATMEVCMERHSGEAFTAKRVLPVDYPVAAHCFKSRQRAG